MTSIEPPQYTITWMHNGVYFNIVDSCTGSMCNLCCDTRTKYAVVYKTNLLLARLLCSADDFTLVYICKSCMAGQTAVNPAYIIHRDTSDHLPNDIVNIVAGYCLKK